MILWTAQGSSNKEERKEGLDIIIKLRKKEKRSKRKKARKVRILKLNLLATKLPKLVELEKAVSSPPTLFKFSDKEFELFL